MILKIYFAWTFIPILLLISCNNSADTNQDASGEKNFTKPELFEYITKVKFPKDYKLLESVDSNFISVLLLELNKNDCRKFYRVNKFKPNNNKALLKKLNVIPSIEGLTYIDTTYRQLLDNNNSLRLWGRNNTTKWIYVIDTITCKLYCQFSNPVTPREWAKSYGP